MYNYRSFMRYGFVIDQDRCIGCHACTVACKEEHQVPIGVFRTWVKYVETGEFPETRRHFGVMRCNHCDDAPCIEICPTHSLFRRSDGIVDFDNRRCIGCKSCMQACPYDALYIDPNNNTAAKCNFCAHRVEQNLEPACVIVCPTQAIIAGDLDHPLSKASRIVATEKVSVRKPHKGTEPKLYYKGINGDLLEPTRLVRQNTYVFADKYDDRAAERNIDAARTREVYDVSHPAPWGWKISTYLWTKAIAAGIVPAAFISAGSRRVGELGSVSGISMGLLAPATALIWLAVTMGFLIFDLKRPTRFFYLLTKANFRSWLVLGGYILGAYGVALTACCISSPGIPWYLKLVTVLLAMAAAGYSAFLFGQAKGRDLWQSSLFFFHLLVQAMVAGSALVLLLQVCFNFTPAAPLVPPDDSLKLAAWLIIHQVMVFGEVFGPHVTEDARLAVRTLVRGKWAARFWIMVVSIGVVIPVFLLTVSFVVNDNGIRSWAVGACILALIGLWFWDDLWVKAGQSVPLS
jgi:Fe-S-cluster-containing dehydrogenase component/formate-dependent nitrite reductase membrane component NrfD